MPRPAWPFGYGLFLVASPVIGLVMGLAGRILIVAMVVLAGNESHPSKYYDLMMMVMLGGRERTEEEFAVPLAAAGLDLARIIPTGHRSASSRP